MTKCKFCSEEAFISIKKYGYHKFGCCPNCFNWILIELDNLKKVEDK